MNYKEFKNPVVAKSMKKARKAAEVNTFKWMSNVSEGLDSELKTLKRLSAQIAKGEIAFSEDYKERLPLRNQSQYVIVRIRFDENCRTS